MPEGEWGGGDVREEAVGVEAGLGERWCGEVRAEGVQDGVAGGVEGVEVGRGIAD